jgi:membrane-associated protease RseP (regulator of RpoE activity)
VLGWINLVLGGFNLIPALPMDGGRILRALLSRRIGYLRATELAVELARGFAIALGLYGLFTLHLYFSLLAVVLWLMATAELQMVRFHDVGRREREVEVLPRGFTRPVWRDGFVVRRHGRGFVIEPLE